MAEIGLPSKGSFMNAAKGYAFGAAAGIGYGFLSNLFGSSLLGSVGTAVVTSALLKGDEGKMLATILGFQAITSGGLNLGNIFGGQTATSDEGSI